MEHRFDLRVYYEDTDLAGIVYYANYLKFIERGRSEFLRCLGIDQAALHKADGVVFAVRHIEADFLRPGRFDDTLVVRTIVGSLTGVRLTLQQDVLRADEVLFSARVTLVALAKNGAPTRLPANIRLLLQ